MLGDILGLLLGYPPCCVHSFSAGRNASNGGKSHPEIGPVGFIPCEACEKRSGKELLHEINECRAEWLPKLRRNQKRRAMREIDHRIDIFLEGMFFFKQE